MNLDELEAVARRSVELQDKAIGYMRERRGHVEQSHIAQRDVLQFFLDLTIEVKRLRTEVAELRALTGRESRT